MSILLTLLLILHVVVAVAVIVLVLLQHGKGADMGAAFGSGSSGSLFGATGSANFLSRATAVLAAFFFISSLALTWFATNRPTAAGSGVMGTMKESAPAKDTPKSDVPRSDVPKTEGSRPDEAPKADATAKPGSAPSNAGSKGSDVPK